MSGIECPDGDLASAVIKNAFAQGLVIETSGAHDQVVKCLVPLVITDEQIDFGLKVLDKAFAAAMEERGRKAS
jgi:diaminobutyrate-2-oxoglutarate transaminase